MQKKLPILPRLEPPGWVEPWLREALEILLNRIEEETTPQRLKLRGFRWEISPEELFVHCLVLASRDWEECAASRGPEIYSRPRFLAACTLFQSEAMFRIEALLRQNKLC